MEQVLEFTRAAAPWIVMGLLLAIFAVRSAVGRKKGKEAKQPVAFFEINRSV